MKPGRVFVWAVLPLVLTTSHARPTACNDKFADLAQNCNSCLPGYTKNSHDICVPEAPKTSPVLELLATNAAQAEVQSGINQNLLIAGAATIAVGGVAFFTYAIKQALNFRDDKYKEMAGK